MEGPAHHDQTARWCARRYVRGGVYRACQKNTSPLLVTHSQGAEAGNHWPLFAAVHRDDVVELKRVIDATGVSPDVRAVTRGGNTPLHLCKSTGMLTALLNAGADPDTANEV